MNNKIVPQFPGLQKGEEPTTVQSVFAELVKTVINNPVLILSTGHGEDPIDHDVNKLPVHMVQIPTLGKEFSDDRVSLHKNQFWAAA